MSILLKYSSSELIISVSFKNGSISVFALNTFSLVFRNSRCESPILVIIPTFGSDILANNSISPKSLIPISKTIKSSFFSERNKVKGNPM